MKLKRYTWALFALLALLFLSGCSASQADPALAIDAYIQALAAKDKDALIAHSCLEWEETALLELDSLSGVTAVAKDLACEAAGEQGEDRLVFCSGTLELNYSGELQSLDLTTQSFVARYQDGEWRMCGRAAAVK